MGNDDFFEEETSTEEAPKKKIGKESAKKGKQPAKVKQSKTALDFSWVVALVVFAFVVGFAIGTWVVPALTGSSENDGTEQQQVAPSLSPEQMQQGLPEGHPQVGGGTTATSPGQ